MSLLLLFRPSAGEGTPPPEPPGPDNASNRLFRDRRDVVWAPYDSTRSPTPMKDSLRKRG